VMLLGTASRPGHALIDGKALEASWGAQQKTLRFAVPAGRHTIALGDQPHEITSHEPPPLRVQIADQTAALPGYARRRARDVLYNWWGSIALKQDDRYRLALRGPGDTGAGAVVNWDGKPIEFSRDGDGAAATLWARPGHHYVTLSGTQPTGSMELKPLGQGSAEARMLPKAWSPPDDAIVHEAEEAAAEGRVKGKIMEKVAASGGVAHAVWDTPGQWAQWRFTVPEDGRYNLVIRAASVYDDIYRELMLDGEPLQGAPVAKFESTGGWCRTTDDWRYFRIADGEGRPVVLTLSGGEHVLRMEQLDGSMNLDVLAFVPAE
jgi:hypothetical protein